MRTDISRMRKRVEELRRTDESKRGEQPLMVYECYLRQGRGDTEICEKCWLYWKCEPMLRVYGGDSKDEKL